MSQMSYTYNTLLLRMKKHKIKRELIFLLAYFFVLFLFF